MGATDNERGRRPEAVTLLAMSCINERRCVWALTLKATATDGPEGPRRMLAAHCERVRVGVRVRALRRRTGMRLDPPAANDRLRGTVF